MQPKQKGVWKKPPSAARKKKNKSRYDSYLNSAKWKAKREEAFAFYGRKCQACGAMSSLHVHHVTYETRGRERMLDLRVLCSFCHDAVHRIHRKGNTGMSLERITDVVIRSSPRLLG